VARLSRILTIPLKGFGFDRAVERLTDLALLDAQQQDLNSTPRFALHPLVRAFVNARLVEIPAFEAMVRERWLAWCAELVSTVGYAWNDLTRLKRLDQERETIFSALLWARDNSYHAVTCHIAKNSGYYYYVRGDWNRLLSLQDILIEAASQIDEIETEIQGLVHAISVLSEQGNISLLPSYLGRLDESVQRIRTLPSYLKAEVLHANAMAKLALEEIESAQQYWLQSVEIATQLGNHKASRNRYWLAICYRKLGMYAEAQEVLEEGLDIGLKQNYERGLVSFYIEMANLAIAQSNVIVASNALHHCKAILNQEGDSRSLALIKYAFGRFHILCNSFPAAHTALAEAIDLFERLGMRRELAEARAELAQLEPGIAVIAEPTQT
jgi:tetratricopeptide (TPR) repeat protein